MFGDGAIRVLLDWAAVRPPAYRVLETFTRSRAALGDLVTVWYVTPDGAPAEHHTPHAQPLTIGQAAVIRDSWPSARRCRVAEFVDRFRDQGDPVHLVLPTIELPGQRAMLLDGNHRTSAAFLAEMDVRLLMFTLSGPFDAAILPDLAHHVPVPTPAGSVDRARSAIPRASKPIDVLANWDGEPTFGP